MKSLRLPKYDLSVAAAKKITPEMEAEILRRRAAGERITAIGETFGIAHQTVSKLVKRAAARSGPQPRQDAGATTECENGRHSVSTSSERVVRDSRLPTVFASWEERLTYYAHRALESEGDWLNYRDALNGHETPAERRARERGVPLRTQ